MTGLLRPKGKLPTSISTSWSNLQTLGNAPDRIP